MFEFHRYLKKRYKRVGKGKVERDQYRAVSANLTHKNGLYTSLILSFSDVSYTEGEMGIPHLCSDPL